MRSQELAILNHLKAGHSLTQLEALSLYGCFRLASRIHKLRENHWPIFTDIVDTDSGKRIAKYSISGNKDSWPED